MPAFGIDTGTANNEIVKLDGGRLSREEPLRDLPEGRLPEGEEGWTTDRWSQLAGAVAGEINERDLHPLGVDAALAVATASPCRYWEKLARGFETPPTLDPLPIERGSRQQKGWVMMARLWTEVTYLLVTQHGWTLWCGESFDPSTKLIVEVYPRLSWLTVAAFHDHGIPIESPWRQVAARDRILEHLGLSWQGRRPGGPHTRDAAICAVTVQRVIDGRAGYLGEPIQHTSQPPFSGGGVAVPR